MSNVIVNVAILLGCGLATIFQIISIAIPYWTYGEVDIDLGNPIIPKMVLKTNFGLWKICAGMEMESSSLQSVLGNKAFDSCESLPKSLSSNASIQAVQAMAILGMLSGAAGAASFLLSIIQGRKQNNSSLWIWIHASKILTLLAGTLVIIGAIIYGSKMAELKRESQSLGVTGLGTIFGNDFSSSLGATGLGSMGLGGTGSAVTELLAAILRLVQDMNLHAGFAIGVVAGAIYMVCGLCMFCCKIANDPTTTASSGDNIKAAYRI